MQINFYKYHGTGNDFIMIDNRDKSFPTSCSIVAHLCHRRFGIGADGLILLENSTEYDFKMRYFNSDGNEGTMCGNGGRCIVAFAKHLGLIEKETRFVAMDGEHTATINSENIVKLKMQNVSMIENNNDHFFLNTGSPHVVKFIDNHKNFDTYKEGSAIRNSDKYKKEGTNVNFVSIKDSHTITASTFERGVEDETYSCGTGCIASAIVTALKLDIPNPIEIAIKTKGGSLKVYTQNTNGTFDNTFLEGPTESSFSGQINI